MNKLMKNITFQVVMAIIFGVLIGHYFPAFGQSLKPFGDTFIKLIKMVIGPIVFLTIVTGVAHVGDVKQVGKIGGKALIYFEIVTTIALIIGMLVMNIVQPGAGFDMTQFGAVDISKYTSADYAKPGVGFGDFIVSIIPDTFISAFTSGNLLQILLIALLTGFALASMGDHGRAVLGPCERLTGIFFKIIKFIMYLAPLGAFGAIAFTVGKFGIQTMIPLLKLFGLAVLSLSFFIVFILGSICWMYKFNIFRFISYIKDEIVIVLGTASSETVLPRMMEKLEKMGCSKTVVGLVLPTGYSFNLDGTSLYLSMCVLFIGQVYGIEMSFMDQLTFLGIMLFTSKGAAGVVGSAFIVLAATVQATGVLPMEGLALLLGIDRFMSSVRAATNLIGNGVATVVMAKVEKEFNEKVALDEYRDFFQDETIEKI